MKYPAYIAPGRPRTRFLATRGWARRCYENTSAPGASGDREHACCATAVLGPLARETANHRRENYLQTQHSTRPALEQSPVEATSLGTQPASLRCACARIIIFVQGGDRAAGHEVSSVDRSYMASCVVHLCVCRRSDRREGQLSLMTATG